MNRYKAVTRETDGLKTTLGLKSTAVFRSNTDKQKQDQEGKIKKIGIFFKRRIEENILYVMERRETRKL